MGKKYNLLKNTKSVQYEPTFRHEYYKRLLAYYWLEIKTHFQNPLTYLFMLALIIVATFVATFIVTLFFTTNQKTGTSITLLVSLFGVISAYRLFFVSANTQFNSARLKQAYLYFPAKHVLRAQLLREFLSNVLLLFFYLCLWMLLLRVIPNHNVDKPAYNFLNKGDGTTSLGAQFLFDFFALITISFIYGTFFLVGHLLASSYAKSRTGFNFIFSALGVVFLFVFFAIPFLVIFVSDLSFLQNMPNYTWAIPILNWVTMISQAFDVYNVKYTATPVPLHLGGLNVLNVFAMSGYIWILIFYTVVSNELIVYLSATHIKAMNSNK